MVRKHPLAKCEECPLAKEACAPTTGPADAKVAVVSRSPGFYEAQKGRPFSGPSGKILEYLLKLNGYNREDVLLTNVVLCNASEVPDAAIEACKPRLFSEIANAEIILACGSEAADVLAETTVGAGRGYVQEGPFDEGDDGAGFSFRQKLVVTNNPAIVLRESSTYVDLVKDFKLALNPVEFKGFPKVRWTNDTKEAKIWLRQILEQKPTRLACDVESRGNAFDATVVSIAFSTTGERAVAFGERIWLDSSIVRDYLRPLLELTECTYYWHSGKFDIQPLRNIGINARVDEDTLLLHYATDDRTGAEARGQPHALETLTTEELGWPVYETKEVKHFKRHGAEKNADGSWKYPVPDSLYDYNALDAAALPLLYPLFWDRASKDQTTGVYRNLLLPASEALAQVETSGVHYDIEAAADLNENEVLPLLRNLKAEIGLLAGDGSFNPNSNPQTKKLVYDAWQITHEQQLRPKRYYSFDKQARESILRMEFVCRDDNSDLRRQLVYDFTHRYDLFKALDKQRSTYIEGLIRYASRHNGKIHCHYRIPGTETGRLSSSEPNMQNITHGAALGDRNIPNIRALFKASPDRQIVSADYSQAELRCIAKFSGDRSLLAIYRGTGRSLHKEMVVKHYGSDYTYEQYVKAKNINFGVTYGQSAEAFSKMYHMPKEEAQAYIDTWWTTFPDVKKWTEQIAQEVRRGPIVNPFGRKRRFHLITKENYAGVVREAINFKPQSTAGDLTLYSLCVLAKELNPDLAAIIITVHDNIVSDVVDNYVDECAKITKQVMESAPVEVLGWTDIPFVVDISVGEDWGNLTEIEV